MIDLKNVISLIEIKLLRKVFYNERDGFLIIGMI
jgi:hypothetical protein